MSPLRQQATICASNLPTGIFGIDDTLLLIEVVYYTFRLWQTCHMKTGLSVDASLHSNPRRNYRFACMTSRKAFENFGCSVDDLTDFVDHLLDHVCAMPSSVVSLCCTEPVSEDIANVSLCLAEASL